MLFAAIVITLLSIPAPFTMDENSYLVTALAVEQGQLFVPGTENLPASRALRYFCPQALGTPVTTTPVYSKMPPLYGFLAAPFMWGGWYGLVFINALSFLAITWLVFRQVYALQGNKSNAWLASVLVLIGSFYIEYAMGLWPHMLSVFLVFSGYLLVHKSLSRDVYTWSCLAGLVTATAVGLRYQNIIYVVVFAIIILLFSISNRFKKTIGYVVGGVIPLILNSIINHMRFNSFNPISKGPGYLSVHVIPNSSDGIVGLVERIATSLYMLWARVVDYSVRPMSPVLKAHYYVQRDPETGAYIVGESIKKALMQSAPWVALSMVVLISAWFSLTKTRDKSVPETKILSIIVFFALIAFSIAGPGRFDGFCFNQRYLAELLPFLVIALALGIQPHQQKTIAMLVGFTGLIVMMILNLPHPLNHTWLYMSLPILIGAALIVFWGVSQYYPKASWAFSGLLGCAIGWALFVHSFDDLAASRKHRRLHEMVVQMVAPLMEEPSALFAYRYRGISLGVLQLDRDLVIVDPHADNGETAGALAEALKSQGRHIYVFHPGMPQRIVNDIVNGVNTSGQVKRRGDVLLEIQ